MRKELSILVCAFQEKTKALSNRLTEAAAEKAALECTRTSVGNAHAEGIRCNDRPVVVVVSPVIVIVIDRHRFSSSVEGMLDVGVRRKIREGM